MRSAVVTAFALSSLVSVSARAQAAHSSAPPTGHVNTHHATPARIALMRGMAAYVSRNYDDALTAFREAAADDGQKAEATLDIGTTLAARGDGDGAIAQYRQALTFAVTANDDLDRARALQAIANALEVRRQWDDAIAAWTDFITFADAHATIATSANGHQRIDAIHARQALDQRMVPVRQRIEQRRLQNAHGPAEQHP